MLQCPECRNEIGDDDFNVATDLVYCRACRTDLKYSDLRATVTGADLAILDCPRHVKVNELGNRTEITFRRVHPVLWILIPFTCLWSGISLGMGVLVPLLNNQFDPKNALFMLPFLFGTLILVSVIFFLLLGKQRIILDGDQSLVSVGVGLLSWRRRFDESNVTQVTVGLSSVSINERNVPEIRLMMKEGPRLAFGVLLTDESRQYIASLLAARFRDLNGSRS